MTKPCASTACLTTAASAHRTRSRAHVIRRLSSKHSLGATKTSYHDDIINGWVGIGSQLDGLGHVGIDGVYYNCSKGADVIATGGLKWAVEVLAPERPNDASHVHQILLAMNGIYILENVDAAEAVADGVYEGFFTVGPSRVTGAAQSIINPILVY